MTSERAIVKAILAYLNGLPGCLARKRWGGGMGVAGDPDIDACIRGRSVQLEVKRPGEKLSSKLVKAPVGKTVAVIGGGDAAMEEASFLTKFADLVHLVGRVPLAAGRGGHRMHHQRLHSRALRRLQPLNQLYAGKNPDRNKD